MSVSDVKSQMRLFFAAQYLADLEESLAGLLRRWRVSTCLPVTCRVKLIGSWPISWNVTFLVCEAVYVETMSFFVRCALW